MEIITDAQLLAQIEAFLAKHKDHMTPSRFGREALRDPALVFQLRGATNNKDGKPRSLTLEKAVKVAEYMRDYTPPEQAAA